jgi:hypothetical protein
MENCGNCLIRLAEGAGILGFDAVSKPALPRNNSPVADGSHSFASLPLLILYAVIIRPFDVTGIYRV